MYDRVPPERYPWWIKFSLATGGSRNAQWLWVVVSGLLGVALLGLALFTNDDERFWFVFGGGWLIAGAVLSLVTIRWMDRNGTWG